jgi:predicted DNA binding CopG/RHH family protein
MLIMAKKKQTFQFLFSTTDLDFDPKRVEVVDSKTGKKLKVESAIKKVGKKKDKTFGVRMAEDEIHKIRKTARRADMEIGEFARQAMEKAVKEKEADLQRLKKNKR